MASTTKATFAAGAELGLRCLTNIEYGNCLSGGSELSSCTRVKGMALKWGRGSQHPKAPRSGKKQDARNAASGGVSQMAGVLTVGWLRVPESVLFGTLRSDFSVVATKWLSSFRS